MRRSEWRGDVFERDVVDHLISSLKKGGLVWRVPHAGSCGNGHSRVPTEGEVALRAYEIHVSNGRPEGREMGDWMQAEHQLADASQAMGGGCG
jgi:hypothetical protein